VELSVAAPPDDAVAGPVRIDEIFERIVEDEGFTD
jgi:hypothetical protein